MQELFHGGVAISFEISHIIAGRSISIEADSEVAAPGAVICRRTDCGAFTRTLGQRSGATILKSRLHFSSIEGNVVVSGGLTAHEVVGVPCAVDREGALYLADADCCWQTTQRH